MIVLHFHEEGKQSKKQQVNEGEKVLDDAEDPQNQKPKTSKKS